MPPVRRGNYCHHMAVDERRGTPLHPAGPPVHSALRGTEEISLEAIDRRWGATIERESTAGARVERAIRRATRDGGLEAVDRRWLEFLATNLQVSAFLAQETARVLEQASDRCLWGSVSRHMTLQASMLTRQAQAQVLYAIDLEAIVGERPTDQARAQWIGGRAWQPARELLDALALHDDWAEILVAVNLCFEPLVSQLMRFEWGTRIASSLGDTTTPIVAEATQVQQAWLRDWTVVTVRQALDHPVHGEANRAFVRRWLTTWGAKASEAGAALTTLTTGLPDPLAGEQGLTRVRDDHRAIVESLELGDEEGAA